MNSQTINARTTFMSDEKHLDLFGGARAWNASEWTASDDRVRGGKSQSYLECTEEAVFRGTLDIKTLGGAGFASQRTVGQSRSWDLSKYAGIQIDVSKGDKKRYTFILKDEILPPDPATGREQSSLSYEADFELPPQTKPGDAHGKTIFIPWRSLNPTYRGKLQKDAKPLDVGNIKRVSIMIRSFFGSQQGDFSLSVRSIRALTEPPPPNAPMLVVDDCALESGSVGAELRRAQPLPTQRTINSIYRYLIFSVLGALAILAYHRFSPGMYCGNM